MDLRVTKKERTLAFFSAAGCMIGAGYGYYRESETTSIIGGSEVKLAFETLNQSGRVGYGGSRDTQGEVACWCREFECEFDLRVTKKERTLAFFSAAGCMIGAG
jgi:hypothetical protein